MDREDLYPYLPVAFQNAACSLEGWKLYRGRLGGAFPELLRQAEARSFWPVDRVRAFQEQRLRAFVRHCVDTVPFYRRRFQALGIGVEDIRTIDDLQRSLPVMTKQDVRELGSELTSQSVLPKDRVFVRTSGSTGTELRFPTTRRGDQEQWATWWRYRRWHGLDLGIWCGYFAARIIVPAKQSRPPFWRYNPAARLVHFSAHHMSPQNLNSYLGELCSRRIPWLHGYPSLLALLAAHVVETGHTLDYPLRWITTSVETLLPQQADLIERAFGVRPRQHYGMAEAVANFSECEMGALHVDEDFAAVEFIANPDGTGDKVIGTNFTNWATPLLRYDVEDLVSLSDVTCSCGRPGRVVEQVDGRLEDYVLLRNGVRLARLSSILKGMVNIREAQIYQRCPGEMVIRVVRSGNYTEADERKLLDAARKRVGDAADVHIAYVDALQRTARGKLRFVVSELPDCKIGAPGT